MKEAKAIKCSLRQCHEPFFAKGFCKLHYFRVRRTGTTKPRCNERGCREFATGDWGRGLCAIHMADRRRERRSASVIRPEPIFDIQDVVSGKISKAELIAEMISMPENFPTPSGWKAPGPRLSRRRP